MGEVYEGLQLVELCDGVAGPVCGLFFADLGASVTRLELAPGDRLRRWGTRENGSFLLRHLNRGKTFVPVSDDDLHNGRLDAVVARADVLLVHFDPIERARLSMDWRAFAERHSHLIVCELTDFGHVGPFAGYCGSDLVLQAMSGLTRYLGEQTRAPLRVGSEIAWHAAGMAAFQAVAAALLARARDGIGQYVHVCGLRALISMKSALLAAQSSPDAWQGFHLNGPHARPDHGWKTRDGHVTFDFRHDQRAQWAAFCDAIGVGHIVDDPAYANWRATIFTGDRRHDLGRVYEPFFTSHSSREVSETINRFGGISVPVLTLREVLDHPQVASLDAFVSVDGAQEAGERQLGLPFSFDRSLLRTQFRQAAMGSASAFDEIAGGRVAPPLHPPAGRGGQAPLAGIRVLDASIGGVGPWAGSLLGMLGAEVIKLESPQGDFIRNIMPTQHGLSTTYVALNANKKGIVLDLKRQEDRDRVLALVRQADVWIENFRPGTADKLGVGYRDLSAINPRLIYASASGFGRHGPLCGLGATDPHVQAFSGFASLNGESPDDRQIWRWYGHVDVSTATNIVQAVLVALHDRLRSGRGALVEVSMLRSALTLQRMQVIGCLAGETMVPRGSASAYLVPDQAFRALDEPVAISATNDQQWQALCGVLELQSLHDDARFSTNAARIEHRDQLIPLIAERIATRPAWWWVQRLQEAHVPSARFMRFQDYMHHEHYLRNGIVCRLPCPTGGEVWAGGSPWEFARGATPPGPAPFPGQHTESVRSGLWSTPSADASGERKH